MRTKNIEDKYIGSRLKLRRSQLGVSQTQLAKFEKLTFQQVQKYESGVNKIASGRLYRFARILHVPINYFYEGIDDFVEINSGEINSKFKPITNNDPEIYSDLRKLNSAFLKINNQKSRKAIISLAKNLL